MKTFKQLHKLFVAILLAFTPAILHATAQVGEKLEYNGETSVMFSTPLEDFFSEENPRPNDVLRADSSANWRGYIGHWKIEDKQFILTGLYRGRYMIDDEGKRDWKETLIPAAEVLGDGASYPVAANWFSGKLRIPRGEMVRYVHMGFGSQYEKDIVIEIKEGQVIKEVEVTYDAEGDSYRSRTDMQWVALGEGESEGVGNEADEEHWVDGRLLPTPVAHQFLLSGNSFRTRGVFFPKEEVSYLWIPDTPKTEAENLPLNRLPQTDIPGGSHVEIVAHFYRMEEGFGLQVDSIRPLKPGETFHHPEFPAIWKELQEWMKEQEGQSVPNGGADSDSTPIVPPSAPEEE